MTPIPEGPAPHKASQTAAQTTTQAAKRAKTAGNAHNEGGAKRLRFLLIDHYDSFTYNLLSLIELQGIDVDLIKNDEYLPICDERAEKGGGSAAGNALYDALVFSPGPSNPANAGSSLRYFDEWAGKLPIFGVCLGMQIMAYKLADFGGESTKAYRVRQARSIQHGKTDELEISAASQLLAGVPNGTTVVRYHSLAIDAPAEQICARAASDGEAMSLEIPEQKLYAVQFHPESLLSEYGEKIVQNFAALVRQRAE